MPTSPKSVRLEDEVWARLDALALERGTKVNTLVAEAIAALLEPPKVKIKPIPLAHTPENLPKPATPQLAPGRKPLRSEAEREAWRGAMGSVPFVGDLRPARALVQKGK